MASITRSAVVAESAAKMPPQWNQRTPSSSKSCFQFTSPGASCEAADQPRSLQPTAPRRPYPRSVKFKPTRAVRPMPSKGAHLMCERSTPPCSIRSSSRRPASFSTIAVTTVVRRPKQRRNPRTTLYSPPPSQTRKLRAVRMRPSPGSSRSMTSPSAAASQRQLSRGLTTSAISLFPSSNLLDQLQRGTHAGGNARVVAGLQQVAAHQVRAHADARHAGAEPALQRGFRGLHASRGHDGDPRARPLDALHEGRAAHFLSGEYLDDFAARSEERRVGKECRS